MAEINAAYLDLRYSGGASNANPAASLGGIISSTKVSKFTAGYFSLGNATSISNTSAYTTGGPFQITDMGGFPITNSSKVPYPGDSVNKQYVGLKIKDGLMGLFDVKVAQGVNASTLDFYSPLLPWDVHPSPLILEGVGKYLLKSGSTKAMTGSTPRNYDPNTDTIKNLEHLQLRHGNGILLSNLTVGKKVFQPNYISQDIDVYKVKTTGTIEITDSLLLNQLKFSPLQTNVIGDTEFDFDSFTPFVALNLTSVTGIDGNYILAFNSDYTSRNNTIFDNMTKNNAYNQIPDYRCIYLTNTHPTDSATNVGVYIAEQPSALDSLTIGLDPAGVNGGATTIASSTDAPAGVIFTASDYDTPLNVGTLAPGDSIAFWLKRVSTPSTIAPTIVDASKIGYKALL